MRKGLVIPAVLAGLAATSAGGCGVGEGSGYANGMLWIYGCREGKPWGTPDAPEMYKQDPTFFAGEPIEGISDGATTNRLIIRMQGNGNAVEFNDTLYFDIRDSEAIAKCLRGKTDAGVPDWDTTSGAIINDVNGVTPADQPPWCEPPATADGLPRIHLVPFGPVAASFAPLASCHSSMHPPAIVNITAVGRDGYIDFKVFGKAAQDDQANIPSDDRAAIDPMRLPDTSFRVNYGDQLWATFHIDLDDERVAAAERDMKVPPPAPEIGGFLDGEFNFDLVRGRSAQTFP